MVSDEWVNRLAEVFAATIREMAIRLEGQKVVYLDISCFAWYGFIELSLLTSEELVADTNLGTPNAVGEWRYYDLSRSCKTHDQLTEIGQEMKAFYRDAGIENSDEVAAKFVQICSSVTEFTNVEAALKTLTRDSCFAVWVFYPDD